MSKFRLSISLFFACALLFGCNSGDVPSPSSTPPNVSVEAPTSQQLPSEPITMDYFMVGETAPLGDWEITLDDFEVTDRVDNTYSYFTPDEGNKYVVVNLTVKNIGTKGNSFLSSFPISGNDVVAKIIYQEKYEFSASGLMGHRDDMHNSSVNPLASKTGLIAFQVVDEAALSEELVLRLSLGRETAEFSLVKPAE